VTRSGARALCVAVCGLIAAVPAAAQQWMADLFAGGARYEALGLDSRAIGLAGGVRLAAGSSNGFLMASAPLEEASPAWAALGGASRLTRRTGPFDVGIDVAADAFVFRFPERRTGFGASTHALPLIGFDRGSWAMELRGGRHDYTLRDDPGDVRRHAWEVGARASAAIGGMMPVVELKSMYSDGEPHPFAGVQLGRTMGPLRAWASAGRWFGSALAETEWGGGMALDAGRGFEVWAAVDRLAADPLYLTPTRTAWNAGISVRLGGRAAPVLVAPAMRNDSLVIRLRRAGRAEHGPVYVAGEFSAWQPVPMHEAGESWEVALPVSAGAVRFSFVDATGEWFVPEDYPGRMSDDMGGYVVLVVVP
jgi:hypothetical protein